MRLLIIGEAGGHIVTAAEMAKKRGARVLQCHAPADALSLLRDGKGVDAVLIGVDQNIAQFAAQLTQERIHVLLVAYGVNAKSQEAVAAIKAGAKEYLPLPPDEEVIAGILQTLSHDHNSMQATAPAMKEVLDMIEQIAPSEASVLITGESGTGKEIMARLIHQKSKRHAQDLVAVNCAAIPEQLLESELFGHEKGAFTGAVARRVGKFEEANRSTLFLDEISEMDLRLQAKLLRALQEREIVRLGGNQPVKLDIRFVATSNRDLRSYVKEGKFREDLFFRLNVIHLHLPPLRERVQDIVRFAEFFVRKYAALNAVAVRPLSRAACAKLERYMWPGNVRELENTMHRAVLLASGSEIDERDIFLMESGSSSSAVYDSVAVATVSAASSAPMEVEMSASDLAPVKQLVGRTMESVEKELILNTLDHCVGNRTQAAMLLGISIRTLRNKLAAYRVE